MLRPLNYGTRTMRLQRRSKVYFDHYCICSCDDYWSEKSLIRLLLFWIICGGAVMCRYMYAHLWGCCYVQVHVCSSVGVLLCAGTCMLICGSAVMCRYMYAHLWGCCYVQVHVCSSRFLLTQGELVTNGFKNIYILQVRFLCCYIYMHAHVCTCACM